MSGLEEFKELSKSIAKFGNSWEEFADTMKELNKALNGQLGRENQLTKDRADEDIDISKELTQ